MLTLGTSALANAYVSLALACAIDFSAATVASNPLTLVNVRTGISNALQKLTKSALQLLKV